LPLHFKTTCFYILLTGKDKNLQKLRYQVTLFCRACLTGRDSDNVYMVFMNLTELITLSKTKLTTAETKINGIMFQL
jgi:hypothetical protein